MQPQQYIPALIQAPSAQAAEKQHLERCVEIGEAIAQVIDTTPIATIARSRPQGPGQFFVIGEIHYT